MPWERAVVVGTVKLWGRVVETQRGWRAEKAYPESFITVVTRVRKRALDGVCLQELGETYATARPFEGIAR
jgi:hypothetical protein